MKQFKAIFPSPLPIIHISIPGLGSDTPAQAATEWMHSLYRLILTMFLACLPLAPFVANTGSIETNIFVYLFFGLGITTLCWGVTLVLRGLKHLREPYGLFTLLFFAFISTTALSAVSLFGEASSANSFGIDGVGSFRVTAGVTLIMFLLLFYLISQTKLYNNFLVVVATLTSIAGLMHIDQTNEIALYQAFALLVGLFFTAIAVKNRSVWFALFGILLFILDGTFASFETPTSITIALFVSMIIVTLLQLAVQRNALINSVAELRAETQEAARAYANAAFSFQHIHALLHTLGKAIIVYVAPLLVILLFITFGEERSVIGDAFENGLTAIGDTFENIQDDMATLLFGNGIEAHRDISTFVSSVIHTQGIVGVLAYGLLFVFALWSTLQSLRNSIDKKQTLTIQVLHLLSFLYGVFFVIISFITLTPLLLAVPLWIIIGLQAFFRDKSIPEDKPATSAAWWKKLSADRQKLVIIVLLLTLIIGSLMLSTGIDTIQENIAFRGENSLSNILS